VAYERVKPTNRCVCMQLCYCFTVQEPLVLNDILMYVFTSLFIYILLSEGCLVIKLP
jgi:hypothetical protein